MIRLLATTGLTERVVNSLTELFQIQQSLYAMLYLEQASGGKRLRRLII